MSTYNDPVRVCCKAHKHAWTKSVPVCEQEQRRRLEFCSTLRRRAIRACGGGRRKKRKSEWTASVRSAALEWRCDMAMGTETEEEEATVQLSSEWMDEWLAGRELTQGRCFQARHGSHDAGRKVVARAPCNFPRWEYFWWYSALLARLLLTDGRTIGGVSGHRACCLRVAMRWQ